MSQGVNDPAEGRVSETDQDANSESDSSSLEGPDSLDPSVGSESGVPLRNNDVTDQRTQDLLFEFRKSVAKTLDSEYYELARRYWLSEPFAYTAIIRNTTTGEEFYRVVEPDLREDEAHLYDILKEKLRDQLIYRVESADDVDREEILEEKVREVVGHLSGYEPSEGSLEKVLYYLKRDLVRFETIDPLMQDPDLEEISCNGYGEDSPVFVFHREFEDIKTNLYYTQDQLRPFVRKLAQRSGKDISTANPLQGTSLPDGSRVQLSLEEVSPEGESFTIRKFKETPFTPVDLIDYGTFSVEQMAYLWLLIENGYSGIIAGGTGSGKTTALNALAMFIPPGEKVITIEDTREVKIPQKNYVATLTREAFSQNSDETDAGIDMFDLLRSALRMRPEYLTVGEVRGSEAYNMFQAMNTGHTTYSTLHADSMQTVLSRLKSEPMSIPKNLIAEIGFVCVQAVSQSDGEKVRRNQGIYEMKEMDAETGELRYSPTWEWSKPSDEMQKADDSAHVAQLRAQGFDARESYEQRTEVLSYLQDENIDGYDPVSTVVRAYMLAPDVVSEQVANDELDLDALQAIEGGPTDGSA